MNISVDVLFQVITLFSTVIGVVWYISNVLGVLKARIAKSDQLNDIQEKKIEALEQLIQNNGDICREGRIKIWEDLNALKLKVAKIEGQDGRG
jgi:hypothetical protein